MAAGHAVLLFVMTSLVCVTQARLSPELDAQITASRENLTKILEHILTGAGKHNTYNRLAELGDRFQSRISGSESLEKAIQYIVDNLTTEGFSNVWKEEVMVPKWTRGNEFGIIHTEWYDKPMFIMALGTSIGTDGNITSEVLVVRSFDELVARCTEAAGKIVVYNQPWVDYGTSGAYRRTGAARASECNATAALVRSVTGRSIYSPHTGVQNYDPLYPKIPVASVTVEDATFMQRFQDRGWPLNVTIYMEAMNYNDSVSYNPTAEIRGWLYPDETVIFGGHIDTWDVTDGSMDDGGGVMMAWEAFSAMKRLGLQAKRTIRLVLWTAEAEVPTTSLVMQADHGSFKPYGVHFSGSGLARTIMEEILLLANDINNFNATTVIDGGGASSDTGEWVDAGVAGVELYNANENYFDYHHTLGDAMSALNADDLDKCTAVWATVAYAVANMEQILPRSGEYVNAAARTQTISLYLALLAAFIAYFIKRY